MSKNRSDRLIIPLETIVIIGFSSFNAHQLITLKFKYRAHQHGLFKKACLILIQQ